MNRAAATRGGTGNGNAGESRRFPSGAALAMPEWESAVPAHGLSRAADALS